MEEDNDDKDDTKRKSRNLSEKKRRDQFNLLVNDLSCLISTTNRKMDKSTVLKSTITFLKHHNDITNRSKIHEIQQDWKPTYLTNNEFTHLMLEALDGFIIVFSSDGTIHYASESITSLLGYLPSDLLNMTIFDLAYEIDHESLYNMFLKSASVIDPLKTDISPDNQISLFIHLKRGALDKINFTSYELIKLVGYIRTDSTGDGSLVSPQSRPFLTENGTRNLIFVGTGRVQTPQLLKELSSIDSSKDEFTSKHSMEWKFLFLDYRAPPIIGYMPFEVLGTSGYDYYHFDDLETIVACHEELMQKGEGKSCCYRFLTKGQQWIWLQTDFYISYHQLNSKPDYVVCTHKVISYADVLRQNKNNQTNGNNNSVISQNPSATVTLRDLECSVPNTISGNNVPSSTTTVPPNEKEKQLQPSKATASPVVDSSIAWQSRASKCSNYGNISSTGISPSVKRKRYMRGNESDSTSMSADSTTSRHSLMSHFSSHARPRHNLSSHLPPQQQQQNTTPHAQHQQQPNLQSHVHKMCTMLPQPDTVNQLRSSSPVQFPQPPFPIRNPQIMGHTFLEPQQYLTAIPVQPVIAQFPVTPVLSPITSTSDILSGTVVVNPTQTQIEDQLQRKHDELQNLIRQQQEELRRVSEQLLIARYTLLQPVVPVNYNNNPTSNRHFNFNSNSLDQRQHQQQQPFVNYNFNIGPSDPLQNNPDSNHLQQPQNQTLQQQILSRNTSVPDLEQFGQEDIDALLNDETLHPTLGPPPTTINHQTPQVRQQQQQQQPDQSTISLNQHNLGTQQDDSLLSYIQLQAEPSSTIHFQMGISDDGSESRSEDTGTQNRFNPYQSQNNQLPNDLEILPYQMSQEQSQILFNSPHTPGTSQ